jgi:hypothetical protein
VNFKRWFQVGDRLVCAPPKCGGTALYCAALGLDPALGNMVYGHALKATTFLTPYEAVETGMEMWQAVRCPVSRFASLWRNKCRDGDTNYPELLGMSPRHLSRYINRRMEDNAHWAPQTYWHRPGVKLVPYTELLGRLGLPVLRVNETVPKRHDQNFPTDWIKRIYAEDAELWAQANR